MTGTITLKIFEFYLTEYVLHILLAPFSLPLYTNMFDDSKTK